MEAGFKSGENDEKKIILKVSKVYCETNDNNIYSPKSVKNPKNKIFIITSDVSNKKRKKYNQSRESKTNNNFENKKFVVNVCKNNNNKNIEKAGIANYPLINSFNGDCRLNIYIII